MATKKPFTLGNDPLNPLFAEAQEEKQTEEKPLFTEEQAREIYRQSLDQTLDDYERATFIVKKDLLKLFNDYAYTERLDKKQAINNIFERFFTEMVNKDEFLTAPEKPKQVHKRKS